MAVLLCLLLFLYVSHGEGASHAVETAFLTNNSCPEIEGLLPLKNAIVPSGYCAFEFIDQLNHPRGLIVVEDKMLIVEEGSSTITSINLTIAKSNLTGFSPSSVFSSKSDIHSGDGLNLGIVYDKEHGFLYASSASQVFRYSYDLSDDTVTIGDAVVVVRNIPYHGFTDRPLLVLGDEILVGCGTLSNVNWSNGDRRSRLAVFDISDSSKFPYDFKTSESYSEGLRNTVGIALDKYSRVWGLDNGVTGVRRPDFNIHDISENNPGEELNLLERGEEYGHPKCWSEYNFSGANEKKSRGPGAQWVNWNFVGLALDGSTDAWCNEHSTKPKFVLQAHMGPLGLSFDLNNIFSERNTDFQTAFGAFHGSSDNGAPVGYRIEKFKISENDSVTSEPILAHYGESATSSDWVRPVNVALGPCKKPFGNCLFFTDEVGGRVIALGKNL